VDSQPQPSRLAQPIAELIHYTAEEAAHFLPVASTTLRKWAYARQVPHHRLGGNLSFTAADIQTISAMYAAEPGPPFTPLPRMVEMSPDRCKGQDSLESPVEENFANVAETAAILRVGEKWLRNGVNYGGFPHGRLGRRLVFSREDRAAIYEMHRVAAQPSRKSPRRPQRRRQPRSAV
jgi:hypothetical protein